MKINKRLLLILVLTIVPRLYHINFPVAGWHSWRQADTAAIARNFATEEMNIAFPAIDWRGDSAGYVESEFQLFTYIIALFYSIFGIHEIFGRLLSLFCSVLTVLGLFLLVKKLIDEGTALWSGVLYAILPLSIFYGRAFMPEQMMLMFSVFGLYYFAQWLDTGKILHYAVSIVSISSAVLLKIPALYLGLPLLFLCWQKYRHSFIRKPAIVLYAAVVFLSAFLWYSHAHSLKDMTGLTFGIWEIGTDKWGNIDLILSWKFYNDVFFKSIAERHFTYPAFFLFLAGLTVKRTSVREHLLDFWLIAVLIYIFIVAKGNQVHEYYQLPFMLPGVVFAARALARIPDLARRSKLREGMLRRIGYGLFALTIVLSILRLAALFDGERYENPLFSMAGFVRHSTPINARVIALSDGNPVVLYNVDRKGWNCSVDEIDRTFIELRKRQGAAYFTGEKSYFRTAEQQEKLRFLRREYTIIADTSGFIVMQL